MRTIVPDRTCWSILLKALEIRLKNKPTYDKLRVLIINKDVRKLLARKNGNENPIWSWNNSEMGSVSVADDFSTFPLAVPTIIFAALVSGGPCGADGAM